MQQGTSASPHGWKQGATLVLGWCWGWLYWPVDAEMQRNKAHRRLCILSEYILLSIGNVKWLTIYIAYCVNCSFLIPKENEMCSLTAASSFLQLRVWGCQCGNWFSNCCEQTDQTSAHTALLCSGWTLLRSSGLRLLGPHGKIYLRRSQQTLYKNIIQFQSKLSKIELNINKASQCIFSQ